MTRARVRERWTPHWLRRPARRPRPRSASARGPRARRQTSPSAPRLPARSITRCIALCATSAEPDDDQDAVGHATIVQPGANRPHHRPEPHFTGEQDASERQHRDGLMRAGELERRVRCRAERPSVQRTERDRNREHPMRACTRDVLHRRHHHRRCRGQRCRRRPLAEHRRPRRPRPRSSEPDHRSRRRRLPRPTSERRIGNRMQSRNRRWSPPSNKARRPRTAKSDSTTASGGSNVILAAGPEMLTTRSRPGARPVRGGGSDRTVCRAERIQSGGEGILVRALSDTARRRRSTPRRAAPGGGVRERQRRHRPGADPDCGQYRPPRSAVAVRAPRCRRL